MGLSNAGENKLLTLFKDSGTLYVGLFTVAPGEDGGGTEVSGAGYARQKVSFGTPAGGSMSNSAALEFPTASANWGTAQAWALFDAASGGTMLWYGAVTEPKELFAGDIYRVDAGNLVLTMD